MAASSISNAVGGEEHNYQPVTLHHVTNDETSLFRRCSTVRSRSHHSQLPFVVGVAGGTASGKTSVCARIMEELEQEQLGVHERRVVTICQDSFYKALDSDEALLAQDGKYNFDHPDALDAEQIVATLKRLIHGEKVRIPVYDFKNNRPDPEMYDEVYPANVIIVEGILIFYFPALRELFHLKLFVDMDADIRLARRVRRDNMHRGRTLENILRQYTMFVKPAFEDYCLPTKTYADIIIPRGAENDVAIQLICQHIMQYLAVSSSAVQTNMHNSPVTAACNGDVPLSAAGRAHGVYHYHQSPEVLPSSPTTSRRDPEVLLLSSIAGRRPLSMSDAETTDDVRMLSPAAAGLHRYRSAGVDVTPVSPMFGHSSAYRRARSFGNESSLNDNEDDAVERDQAFESEVVHHRHHHPLTSQLSRLRRERDRSVSTGSASVALSTEFVEANNVPSSRVENTGK